MTKAPSNGKGKGKARAKPKPAPKPKKPGHCDHGKPDDGHKCAACFVIGTGGKGIRYPCSHGIPDKGNRCVDCFLSGEGGAGICEHRRRADRCKECGGSEICKHGVNKQFCHACKEEGNGGGAGLCEHNKNRSKCSQCHKPGEGHLCLHGRPRSHCRPCGGSDYCEHGRQKAKCDEGDCNGSQVCEHGRHKYQCADCDGSQICPHKKQRHGCPQCNDRFCICCNTEKTAAADAMCKECLSKVTGTSMEEIHLTSIMCCAFYGSPDRLGDVSVQKVDGVNAPFDMVFPDISDHASVVVEHDAAFYHQDDQLERDVKKSVLALNEGHVVIRHRHVKCPRIEIDHDDFHVVEFDGYSAKEYSTGLAVSLVEYVINTGVLNESSMGNAFYFICNPDEFSESSTSFALEFIRRMVLG